MWKRLLIVGSSAVLLAACGGKTNSSTSAGSVRAATIQLIKNVNAKNWEAVRAEITPRYYRSFVGRSSHTASLRYLLPHRANQRSLTPAEVSGAQVSVDGNRATMSFSFAGGNLAFVNTGGRWLLDG